MSHKQQLAKIDNPNFLINQTPNDTVSCIKISPCGTLIAAVSWDRAVAYWKVVDEAASVEAIFADSALLSCCWSPDSSMIFYGGSDGNVGMWDIASGNNQVIANHGAPINNVFFYEPAGWVVSAGWNNEVKFWAGGANTPVFVLTLPQGSEVYSIDCVQTMIAIATNLRQLLFYSLQHNQNNPSQVNPDLLSMTSPLNFQSRCIKIKPDGYGFAIGDMKGAVAVCNFGQDDTQEFTLPKGPTRTRAAATAIFFSGDYLFVSDNFGSIHISNYQQKHKWAVISDYNTDAITSMDYHEGTNRLVVSHGYDWLEGPKSPSSSFIYTLYINLAGN